MLLLAAIFCALLQPADQPPAAPAPAPPPTPTPTPPTQTSAPAAQPAETAPSPESQPRKDANPELILTTKDGSVFQGLLISKDEKHYLLEIAGVPAKFSVDKVSRVQELRPVIERYKELRDAIGPGDLEQRIALVRWLADRRQLDLAFAEAEVLLVRNPRHVATQKLIDDLQVRIDLLSKPSEPAAAQRLPEPATIQPSTIAPTDFPYLTDEQVRLIKVYELDLTARPRILFPREAAARMLEEFAASPLVPASKEGKDAILRQDPLQTVDLMFRLRARDYYTKVRVIDQPEPIRRFRDDVYRTTLLNGCATNQCHGGTEAGRLVLSNFRPNADTTLYTNYHIITNFKASNGQPLIDWDRPEQSLLYQMALPREVARVRHPEVIKDGKETWRPPLTGPDDTRAAGMLNWVKSAYRPRPDYSLDYTPFRPFTPPSPAPPAAPLKSEPVVR